jgi:hypothetical protein
MVMILDLASVATSPAPKILIKRSMLSGGADCPYDIGCEGESGVPRTESTVCPQMYQ